MSFEIAASLPVATLTALNGLRQCGDIKDKKWLLINGANRWSRSFAVQIAKSKRGQRSRQYVALKF